MLQEGKSLSCLDFSDRMGSNNSKVEVQEILDTLIPKAFRECVTDLSTEHLTDKEKRQIDRLVYRYAEAYLRSKERIGEQLLISDYSDFLY